MFIAIGDSVNGGTGTGTGGGGGTARTAPVFQYKLRFEDRIPKQVRFAFASLSTFPFEVYIGDDTYVINSSADTIDLNVTDTNPTDVSLSVGAEVKLSWGRGGSTGINKVLRLDNLKVGIVEFVNYEDRDFSDISTLPFEILSDLSSCFSGATGLPSNIGLWKVDGVTLFESMFNGVPTAAMSDTFGQWKFGDGADFGTSSFESISDADLASCLVQWEANANQGINVNAARLPFGSGDVRDLDEALYPAAKTAYDNLIANSNWDFGNSINWGPPPPNPLLDDYPNAAVAYSVRKLRTAYSGSAMRVRRTVAPFDEQDIGFDGAGLDEAAIVAFGGADQLTVSLWYDQSTNGVNAAQSTATEQPVIYDGSAVITKGGNPALSFETNLKYLQCASGLDFSDISVSSVYSDMNGGGHILGMQTTNNDGWRLQAQSTGGRLRAGGTNVDSSLSNLSIHTLQTAFAYGGNGTTYINQTGSPTAPASIGTTTSFNFKIGATYNPGSWSWAQGRYQEVVVWDSSSVDINDRVGIESNVNTYFSIY